MVTKADSDQILWFEPQISQTWSLFPNKWWLCNRLRTAAAKTLAFTRRVEPKPQPAPTENPANGSEKSTRLAEPGRGPHHTTL